MNKQAKDVIYFSRVLFPVLLLTVPVGITPFNHLISDFSTRRAVGVQNATHAFEGPEVTNGDCFTALQ